ncbi:MAG: membrane protein insertase YidC [Pseudomonadales bacterium]|nr:membrane protein insertase YidC [Pseudomonadales bacterium]
MDFQRILLFTGMAITLYMLLVAWNEDYGSNAVNQAAVSEAADPFTNTGNAGGELIPEAQYPENTVPQLTEEGDKPEAEQLAAARTDTGRYLTIKTDTLKLTIDRRGGDIVKSALLKFPVSLENKDNPFVLMDPGNKYAAQSGLIGKSGTDSADGRPLFTASANSFTMSEDQNELKVDLVLDRDDARIIKRFTLRRNNYLINVSYHIENRSDEPFQAAMFGQIKRDGQPPVFQDSNAMGLKPYTGGATFTEDKPYNKLQFGDLEDESFRETVKGGYMALVQHYFTTAWVPADADAEYTYTARKLASGDIYLFGFTSGSFSVAPGGSLQTGADFYMGPKNQEVLGQISPGLDLTVDYGILWWLAQPMFKAMTFIHSYLNNWGFAIIGLTIIVKALLFPLSAAGFKSMAKMRKLQPEMARLKERYGDDRQQFSQAMMDLYKKEGANPLGGCLPLLAQMPVFLALYWTLMESVELRQAPFILWINDLSVMDPYFVLPILMGASMFITQMMQPEPPDPMQARVMKFMPLMFTVFFLWFPSGLVLYWLVNNILSILQQWYVTRQIEKAG